MAMARIYRGPAGSRDAQFQFTDQQALCSLISFNIGAFFGRIGDRIGPLKRIWLISGTLLQALLTLAAVVTIWCNGDHPASSINPLSFVALAFISASLGVQGIQGKRLNTQFGTTSAYAQLKSGVICINAVSTVVLTSVWIELVSDPGLFKLRQKVASRDHKVMAAASLFVGAFCGMVLVGKIGVAGTLGVAVGVRVLIATSWIFVGGPRQPVMLS